jgi:translocation and assembly module TamB
MKPIFLKTAKWAGVGIVLLLVLAITFVFSLQTRPIQRVLQDRISSAIPGSIQWERLRFSFWRGAVSLRALEIKGQDGVKIAGFKSLDIHFSLNALKNHTIKVKKLRWKGLTADIVSDSSGQLNIVRAFVSGPSKKAPAPDTAGSFDWNITAEDLRLELDEVKYRDKAAGMDAGLGNLILFATGNWNKREASLVLDVDSGWFSQPTKTIPVSGFHMEGKLASGTIDGLVVTLNGAGASIDLRGNIVDIFKTPHGNLAGFFKADLSEINRNIIKGEEYSGSISGEVAASGDLKNPEVKMSVDYSGGNVSGYPVKRIQGTMSLKEMVCTVPGITVSAGGGSVELRARADLEKAFPGGFTDTVRNMEKLTGEISIKAEQCDLSQIDTALPHGRIGLDAAVAVTGVQPGTMKGSLALTATVKDLATNAQVAPLNGNINLRAGISSGQVTVEKAMVRANGLTLDVSGKGDLLKSTMDLTMDLKALNLVEVTEPVGLNGVQGSVESHLKVRGNFDNPEVHAEIKGDRLVYADVRIGALRLLSHLSRDGTLGVEELSIRNGMSKLNVAGQADLFQKGTLKLLSPPHFGLSLVSKAIYLRDFLDSIDGTITLAANLSGSPDSMAGMLALTADRLITGVQSIQSVSIMAGFHKDSVAVENLFLKIDERNTVTGKGYYTFKNRFGGTLDAVDLSLQGIEAVKKLELLNGKLSLHIQGSGSIEEPVLSGTVALAECSLGSEPLKEFDVVFSLENGTADLRGKGLLGIDAQMGLKTGTFSVDMGFDSTDITPFLLFAGMKEMSGLLDGKVTAAGTTHQIDHLSAAMNLSLLQLRSKGLTLLSGKKVIAEYRSGAVTIPGFSLAILDHGQLSVKGSGSLDSTIGFSVDAAIPLDALTPLVPDLPDLTGMLGVKGTIKGTLNKPVYLVTADLSKTSFTIPGLEQSLHSLKAKSLLDTSRIMVEYLAGSIGDGGFKLSGQAEHTAMKLGAVLSSVELTNLPIAVPGVMDVVLEGSLKLKGDSTASKITGEMVVLEGLYYLQTKLSEIITSGEKRRKVGTAPDTTEGGLLGKTVLDIAVKARAPFLVDNNLAYMEIKPDVQIKGTLKKPVISGRGTVESGIIKWKKRDFKITRGIVDFLNPYETQATLDIKSEIGIEDWLIQLEISGTAPDALSLKLSEKNADPPLEDADIISILVSGRTTAELLGGEGGRTKEQLLASLLAAEVSKQLQDRTVLDKVEIEAGRDGDKSGTSDIKVTVGKNLSRRLTTLYSIETGSDGIVQRGTAEYKLLQRLLFSGFQETDGKYGSALEWNIQWR